MNKKNNESSIKTKILLTYHKPAVLVDDDIFVPIHAGRDVGQSSSHDYVFAVKEDQEWLHAHMIGDNTGDHISHLNRNFCEMTVIYWAWKNYEEIGDPDYIGFMHYRRHLSFNTEDNQEGNHYHTIFSNFINDDYLKKFKLNSVDIHAAINGYDLVTSKPVEINPYQDFEEHHNIDDYDVAMSKIIQKYPQYQKALEVFNNGNKNYYCNLFIARKEVFFEYCEWIFPILFDLHESIKLDDYSSYQKRFIGFLSERLFGIFITHKLLTCEDFKLKELMLTHVKNTDLPVQTIPAFSQNNIPVVFASDLKYAKYLGVAIKSLIDNASDQYNYDILVLEDGFSEHIKALYLDLIKDKNNFRIRFFNLSFLKEYYKFETSNYISAATYYRFFIARMFPNYDKIVYLDCDLVILTDVADLYHHDLGDNYLAAVYDFEAYRCTKVNSEFASYFKNILNLPKGAFYFNAGVLLINNKAWKENNLEEKFLKLFEEGKRIWFYDQCILNTVCANKVLYLKDVWNVEWQLQFSEPHYELHLSEDFSLRYQKSIQEPKIIHFAGPAKPWFYPELPLAQFWWKYARKTHFYEDILFVNAQDRVLEIFNALEVVAKQDTSPEDRHKILTHENIDYFYRKFSAPVDFVSRENFMLFKIPLARISRSENAVRVHFLGIRIFKKIKEKHIKKFYIMGLQVLRIERSKELDQYYLMGLRVLKKLKS